MPTAGYCIFNAKKDVLQWTRKVSIMMGNNYTPLSKHNWLIFCIIILDMALM